MEDLKNLIDGLVDASYGDGLFVRDDVLTNLDQLNIPEKYLALGVPRVKVLNIHT